MIAAFDMAAAPDDNQLENLKKMNYRAACGYLGGNTPSPWRSDDWKRVAGAGLLLLPIWVARDFSYGHGLGAADGNRALVEMQTIGLGGVLCLDIEAGYTVDQDWINGFQDALEAGSCDLGLYGRGSDLKELLGSELFTWVANPQSSRDIFPNTVGVQLWYSGRYDGSLFADDASWASLG